MWLLGQSLMTIISSLSWMIKIICGESWEISTKKCSWLILTHSYCLESVSLGWFIITFAADSYLILECWILNCKITWRNIVLVGRHSKGYPTSAKPHFSQCYNLKWFNLTCTRLMANCIHNTDWWSHGPGLSFSKIIKNSKLHQATAENIEWPEWPGPDLMILL